MEGIQALFLESIRPRLIRMANWCLKDKTHLLYMARQFKSYSIKTKNRLKTCLLGSLERSILIKIQFSLRGMSVN